jgi:hypothetical protein
VTAADGTGAAGSVSFDIVAVPDLRAAYHAVTGPVTLHVNFEPADDMCLYDPGNGTANGTKVELWACDGSAAERWTYLPDSGPDSSGTLVIHGKCATIVNGAPRHGQRLRLEPCTGAGTQGWSLQFGTTWLYNPASGLCMRDPGDSRHDGTQVGVLACNIYLSEAFVLPPGPVLSGVGGRCLTDPGNSSVRGVRLTVEPCDGSAAQLWAVFSDWNLSQHNGLCVTAAGNPYARPGVVPGVALQLVGCTFADDYWVPLPDGQVMNGNLELCLAAAGSGRAQAAVVEPCYGEAGEIWAEG